MKMLELIVQRPLDERPSQPGHCPYCESTNVRIRPGWSTMIGGGDGTPDGDPNHRWNEGRCVTCGQNFLRELKDGNVWYTNGRHGEGMGRVLEGVDNCFERYVYTCATCDGDVTKQVEDFQGQRNPSVTSYVAGKKQYWEWYECADCGAGTERT